MEVHELSFYPQFRCTMGDCPNTCCHGWQIVFDDETCTRFQSAPGLAGIRLRCGITRRNGMTMFRRRRGRCPFLTKERACGIQLNLGEEYMPEVCRIFPRQSVSYGDFAEETLFLACPEAARLFLRNLDALCFRTVERPLEYARLGTNEDSDFLRELVGLREKLTECIRDVREAFPALCARLLTYAGRLQRYYIRQGAKDTQGLQLPELTDCADGGDSFTIPAAVMDRMITGGFCHILLKVTSPFLYRLCRMYFREFDNLTGAQADVRADALRAGLAAEFPGTDAVLRGHLVYYLMLEFLSVYENYSFVRVIATGIMHTQLLELFLALYYEKTRSLTEDEIIQIIAVLDRRGRHCAEVEAGMYDALAPFLKKWIDA